MARRNHGSNAGGFWLIVQLPGNLVSFQSEVSFYLMARAEFVYDDVVGDPARGFPPGLFV